MTGIWSTCRRGGKHSNDYSPSTTAWTIIWYAFNDKTLSGDVTFIVFWYRLFGIFVHIQIFQGTSFNNKINSCCHRTVLSNNCLFSVFTIFKYTLVCYFQHSDIMKKFCWSTYQFNRWLSYMIFTRYFLIKLNVNCYICSE